MGSGILRIKVLGDASGLDKTLSGATSGLAKFGKMAGVALAAAGVAAVAGLGKFAFDSAVSIDKAMDTIRVGTGATGEALAGLGTSFETVFKNVPDSAENVGKAIADLNTRTGATGIALEELATKSVRLAQLTGEDLSGQIAATTRAFGDWSIASDDQADAMDYLFKVSQQTGIGVTSLSEKVVQFGAPLRQLGFDFQTSAALMGKWEKEGVNLETVLAGMKIGLANFSKEGKDTKQALIEITNQIKNAGSQAEANKLAIEVFGQRAGPDMAAAIREGRFELEDLLEALENSPETIDEAARATDDFGEKWLMVKNKLAVALEPLGSLMMDKLGALADWVGEHMPAIEEGFRRFFDVLTGGAPGAGSALGGIGSVLAGVRDIFTAAWPIMVQAVQMFIDFLSGESGKALIESALSAIGTVLQALQSIFETVWPTIQTIIQGFIEWLESDAGKALIETALGAVGLAAQLLQQVFETVWPLIQAAVQMFVDFFNSESGQKLITLLMDGIGFALGALQSVFQAVWPILESVVQAFIGFFDSPSGQRLIKSLVDALGTAMAMVQSIWEVAWPAIEAALKVAAPIIQGLLKAIEGAVWLIARALEATIGLFQKLQSFKGGYDASKGGYVLPGTGTVVKNKAVGGFVTRPEMTVLGENYRPELVLPLTDARRTNQLLAQAGLSQKLTLGPVTINIFGQGQAAGESAADAFLIRLATAGVLS